jgi:erythrin-vacuolar iron transport family protein
MRPGTWRSQPGERKSACANDLLLAPAGPPTYRPNAHLGPMAKAFSKLTEQEILALAISQEEEDSRIYGDFADRFRTTYPSTAATLSRMQREESGHRQRLIDRYHAQFGEHLPLIHRSDVKGLVRLPPVWLMKALTVKQVRRQIGVMELASRRFYEVAASRTTDTGTRKLLGDLALEESGHSDLAIALDAEQVASGARATEDDSQRRMFVLQVVQPGLAGLMDGSVSTLAPLFAAAFATHSSRDAFLVGLASSVGAGISMGFAEALSDDGVISGRGRPFARGVVCGLMTALGGLGHTLPFIIQDFHLAFSIAVGVVLVELVIISWIRHHYMDTPFLSAAFQVIVGGLLVFFAGMLIGSS